MPDAEDVFRRMIDAFAAGDLDRMGTMLADDVVAYVTNAEGGVERVDGAEGYMRRVPDVSDAEYTIEVTQAVTVASSQVLGMVEIRAEREGKTLHNHAAFLVRLHDGLVTEIWMVEALPAYSDEFWS